jgi:hypothetical protein
MENESFERRQNSQRETQNSPFADAIDATYGPNGSPQCSQATGRTGGFELGGSPVGGLFANQMAMLQMQRLDMEQAAALAAQIRADATKSRFDSRQRLESLSF